MSTGENNASVKVRVAKPAQGDQEKVEKEPEQIKLTTIGKYGIFWNPVQVSILIAEADVDEINTRHYGKKMYKRWPDGTKKTGYVAKFSKFNPYVHRGKMGCILNLNTETTHNEYKKLARTDLKEKGFIEIYQEDLEIAKEKARAVKQIEAIKRKYDGKLDELHEIKEREFLERKKKSEGAMNV